MTVTHWYMTVRQSVWELVYLHQVRRHHAPGPHHVQQRPALVADDAQHGLAQAEQVEGAAALQRRLGFACRDNGNVIRKMYLNIINLIYSHFYFS